MSMTAKQRIPDDGLITRGGAEEQFSINVFKVLVNLLDKCNLSCSYCINSSRSGNNAVLDRQSLVRFLAILAGLNKDRTALAFAGGEPFLYPGLHALFADVCTLFPHDKLRISMASNLVTSASSIQRLIDSVGDIPFTILASVHFGQFDLKKYFANILQLPTHYRKHIRFKLLLSAKTLSATVEALEYLEKAPECAFQIGLVYDNNGRLDSRFTPQQKKLALLLAQKYSAGQGTVFTEFMVNGQTGRIDFKNQERIADPSLVRYEGLVCTAGYGSLRIGSTGGVRRCFGFGEEFAITDVTSTLPESFYTPIRCPVRHCTCYPLIGKPKWRLPEQAPDFVLASGLL